MSMPRKSKNHMKRWVLNIIYIFSVKDTISLREKKTSLKGDTLRIVKQMPDFLKNSFTSEFLVNTYY